MTPEQKAEAAKAIIDLAHMVAHYYLELVRCGMGEDRAFELTAQYQDMMISMDIDGEGIL